MMMGLLSVTALVYFGTYSCIHTLAAPNDSLLTCISTCLPQWFCFFAKHTLPTDAHNCLTTMLDIVRDWSDGHCVTVELLPEF